ncbi:hypothetical protein WG922_01190 [Ramlibacter sp. AN1015]|uniref:hypothetical protein n=1 Tax=Ramlibacter sp. AN1015 TaxID=3133428 RepID=UPI0030BAF0E9
MNLPDLDLQILYARLSWGLVLAAVVVALAGRWTERLRPATVLVLTGAAAAAQWLPAPLSPAYWLGLAFQSPSALTTALCALVLRRHWIGDAAANGTLAPAAAAALAAAGGWLYLDASGWTAQGIYFLGFGPTGAPLAALLIGAACIVAIVRGVAVPTACAVLAAVSLFMLVRLPTGNLWDALIDPFAWVWSLVVCARALHARRRKTEPLGELR